MEEGNSFEVWEGVVMDVVYGEVFGWAGEFLTAMFSIRWGWGIE